jgi:hypothetical protein
MSFSRQRAESQPGPWFDPHVMGAFRRWAQTLELKVQLNDQKTQRCDLAVTNSFGRKLRGADQGAADSDS